MLPPQQKYNPKHGAKAAERRQSPREAGNMPCAEPPQHLLGPVGALSLTHGPESSADVDPPAPALQLILVAPQNRTPALPAITGLIPAPVLVVRELLFIVLLLLP